jgi:hypothetical protein
MRLGEGSGALAMQLVDAACDNKMGTLANSNIVLPRRSNAARCAQYPDA